MGQSFGRMIGLDNQDLMRVAASAPMLDKQVELDLARRWRENGDTQALSRLTRSYLRLVISMAGRFRAYGLPMSDLVQEGMVGLMEAAARFEPDRELRFSTYATWWIRAAMQDFILRNWSIVRTGTTAAHKSLFFNLRRLRAQIAGDSDAMQDGAMSHAVRQSLADKLGVRVLDVETMEARLTGGDRSLNMAVGEEPDSEWIDFLACDAPRPDEALETSNDSRIRTDLLREAMGALSHRERTIIEQRKLAEDSVTLAALGERLGISKERVRQIENHALEKLKSALLVRAPDPVSLGLVGA